MSQNRIVTLDTRSEPTTIDIEKTAIIVVDMQNDFGSKGGMFDRAGIDLSMIQSAIPPTANVLDAARAAGIKIVYLKMGFQPDLSDLGSADSRNRVLHLLFGVGQTVRATNGKESRMLVRDTWGTDIVSDLVPQPDDLVIYKHRYSGFYQTELDNTLKQLGITNLIFTGCTTSVCVESTIRDAMFRDYLCVLLADCAGEPIGHDLPRSNHEATLLLVQMLFGWVSSSSDFVKALDAQSVAVV